MKLFGALRGGWHVARFDEEGWVLKHPLRCRLKGRRSLFDCPVNLAMREVEGPPVYGLGDYAVAVTGDGRLHYNRKLG